MVDAVSASQGSVSSQIARVQNDRPTAAEAPRTPEPPRETAADKAPPPPPPPPADTGRGAVVDEVA